MTSLHGAAGTPRTLPSAPKTAKKYQVKLTTIVVHLGIVSR